MFQMQKRTCVGWKLGILWNFGLLLGISVMPAWGGAWMNLVPRAAGCCVSWFGALSAALLPVVISIGAVCLTGPAAVWILCPVRAFLLGMSVGAIGIHCAVQAAPDAWLLLFSGLVSAPVLLVFWYQRLAGRAENFPVQSLLLLAAGLAIAAADVWVVSPFLTDLIIF